MTNDDMRKQWMDIYTAKTGQSDAPSVTDPSASNTQAAAPNSTQAQLQDQFGTGFINYSQYGQGSPETQQYQPIPGSSGSLFDPTAPTPAQAPFMSQMPHWPGQTAQQQLPAEPGSPDVPDTAPNMGPIMKPTFRRTRAALGYRGGEY